MKPATLLCSLIVSLTLPACNRATIPFGEVARIIPQTIEVTRVVPQTIIATPLIYTTPVATVEEANLEGTTPQPGIDPSYYDGIIVITQYYTFLGHGLYEQAYQLLSSTAQRPHSLEEYVRNKAKAFRTIKIITIQPYYLLAEKRCSRVKPETGNERRFFVHLIAEGEGSMSGSALSGALQTLFLSLTREGGEWKIDTFATIGMCP